MVAPVPRLRPTEMRPREVRIIAISLWARIRMADRSDRGAG